MSKYLKDLKRKADQLFKEEKWDELIPVLTELIDSESNPKAKVSLYNIRGLSYARKGEHDKAIADLDKAIELNPEDAHAYDSRGSLYARKGEHDKAIADFDKAIELNPEYKDAYYNRRLSYAEKGEHDKAIADFDKAIELNPEGFE